MVCPVGQASSGVTRTRPVSRSSMRPDFMKSQFAELRLIFAKIILARHHNSNCDVLLRPSGYGDPQLLEVVEADRLDRAAQRDSLECRLHVLQLEVKKQIVQPLAAPPSYEMLTDSHFGSQDGTLAHTSIPRQDNRPRRVFHGRRVRDAKVTDLLVSRIYVDLIEPMGVRQRYPSDVAIPIGRHALARRMAAAPRRDVVQQFDPPLTRNPP